MPIQGILQKDENNKIVMELKELDPMTDEEYRAAVEKEFKKLTECKEKT